MERIGGEHEGQTTAIGKVALASFVGTTIEWYDYFIYGTTAALVFNQLFFPNFSPLAGTLAAFASFAVGFFFRPLGGLIFGHFGDKIGRKSMLILTLSLMGVATFLIGLLPGFQTIGIWAPILLVTLRIVQGIGLGGEWGGAALMVSEHAPPSRRGFWASSVQMGAAGGLLLSSGAVGAVALLTTEAQFIAWGWRIPFLASIVLIFVGLLIRLQLTESAAFTRLKEESSQAQIPIMEVLRTRKKNTLIAIGLGGSNNVYFYTVAVFTLTYATTELGFSRDTMLRYLVITSAAYFVAIPLFGALSDLIGRRNLILGSVAVMGLSAFPYFWLLNIENGPIVLLAMVLLLAIFQGALYAPQAAFIPELFDTRVRYTGASLAYNFPTMIFGGTAPFIATALFAWSGGTWSVALYMVAVTILSFVCALLATDLPMVDEPGGDRELKTQPATARSPGEEERS